MIQTEAVLGQVRHILNEYPAILDDYENETSEALRSFIKSALRLLATELSPVALSDGDITYKQRPDGLYYGVIALPEDYLRFVSFKLEPWAMPVVEAQPVGTSLWLSQFSAAAGVGNGEAMPAVFLSIDTDRFLEAHAVKAKRITEETDPETRETETVYPGFELRYIASPSMDGDEIAINEKALDALAYYTAGLYLQSRENGAAAERCMATAQSMVQL